MSVSRPPKSANKSHSPKSHSRSDYAKIIALTLGLFASVMSTTILSILSPKIINHFSIDYSIWQTRNILFFALFASSQILMGKLADRFNPFKLLYLGITLFVLSCAGSVGAAMGKSWWLFMLFQGIQAVCDAMMALAVVTLIRRSFPDDKLGWAFGCFSATLASGSIAGAGLGGLFNDTLGVSWYWAIGMLGAIATTSLIMVRLVVPIDKTMGGGSFARRESLTVVATIAIAAAIYFAQTIDGFSAFGLGHGVVLAALGVAAFCEVRSVRHGLALIPWGLFRNLHYTSASIRVFLAGIFVNVSLLVFPLAFQQLYGLSAAEVSVMMITNGLMLALLGPVCGRIADRNLVFCLIAGLVLALLALVVISGYIVQVDLYVAYGYYILYGLAAAMSSPAQMKLISLAVGQEKIGQGMGFYQFMQFTSGAFAAGLIGSLFVNADKQLTQQAWQSAITVCIGIVILRMVIISFDIRKIRSS